MHVRVEQDRYLSVACEPGERIVFDRKESQYHLLRESAARLWDEIGEGGTFELASSEPGTEDPVTLLVDAGLVEPAPAPEDAGVTRRVWLRRTGKASAAAIVLPLVATISAPQLALGQGPSLEETPQAPQPVDTPQTIEPPKTLTEEEKRQAWQEERDQKIQSQTSGESPEKQPGTYKEQKGY